MVKAIGKFFISEVIDSVQNFLPALYFTFGRGKTELLADELAREWDFLLPHEKKEVKAEIENAERNQASLFGKRRQKLSQLLMQGIAYHHAGLPPALKDLVEKLYERRLVFVLFCTETFAVGVNFPAAATIFDSCRKWDGREFRNLYNREFFQMAGRAGRRGFDKVGRVFIRIDERFLEQTGFYKESEVEPVKGRLSISPNTVLSLLHWKTDDEITRYLEQNLAAYQNNRESRDLQKELASLEEGFQKLSNYFCDDIYQPSCYLLRNKLKKEMYRLKTGRKRGRVDSIKRREEIRHLLKTPQKNCHYQLCFQTQKKQEILSEKKSRLSRRIKDLERHSRDYEVEFNNMWDLLEQMDFVEGRKLLPRGNFALRLYVQEILVTELLFQGYIRDKTPQEVVAILAGVDYVPGREEYVEECSIDLEPVKKLCKSLNKKGIPEHLCVWSHLPSFLAVSWYEGASFDDLLNKCTLQEGDLFSLLRRTIDLLRQIERASGEDFDLRSQMEHIRYRLDRDEVAIMGF